MTRARRSTLAVCVALAASLLAALAQAAPGDLDPSFGVGGTVITAFGAGSNSAFAIAIQADGKIVAVGSSGFAGDFALARYNTDGSLDGSFGTGGKVTTHLGIFNVAFAVAIQADGKIVAAGSSDGRFALARYNSDGSLDTSFGGAGTVTTSFGGSTQAFAVAIQPDGKIVAAGGTFSPFFADFALARYDADGSLDASFGIGGKVTTDFGGGFAAPAGAAGVAIQADGKIVAAGMGGPSNDFALARYNPDGSLDTSFGSGGKVTTDFGGFDAANSVAIQADGKIVAAGTGGFFQRFALARYNPDGSLDTSFGTGGKVTTQFSGENIESATGLAIQTNGKIVAAGFAFFPFFHEDFALARYSTDGSLDPSFGTAGKVMTDFGDRVDAVARGVAIEADGKIVVAGGAGPCTPPCEFALARYLGDPTAIEVSIDIKPGSFPNSINPQSRGTIPVAVLSAAGFDAPAEVDRASLTFGRTGDEMSLAFCNSSAQDVNGDGLPDLICHFDTLTAGFQPGDTQGVLKGRVVSGVRLIGTDSVNIVPAR